MIDNGQVITGVCVITGVSNIEIKYFGEKVKLSESDSFKPPVYNTLRNLKIIAIKKTGQLFC